ncbi:uncharacterized protein CCR75_005461 [Bremia lactucae]|uniref:Mediator of RNA polymerase II transcription subunit 17 n=1 Tax=Bremia lactucae TaxID=4779 RepID=A0A976IJ75_BRELC|nr:hypothetical protein CCR75_005461 [Bremia lactucae]
MDEKSSNAVGVTLFPADYEAVEMVTDQGKEILQREFLEAQLFLHSIRELERVRVERIKKKRKTKVAAAEQNNEIETENADELIVTADKQKDAKKEDVNEENDIIDPRIYYRPMVSELQAATAELHQLINSIDLIRRHEFLEEMRCIRENTAPKREELEYVVEAKRAHVKESGSILLNGVQALAKTVEKESIFFQGVTEMLRNWKICAPIHGNIPKPFRAGEPLAVDCSYGSAGSLFVPQHRSIADLAYAELSRTEKGLILVKTPENFLARTIQLKLIAKDTGKEGKYTLPSPPLLHKTKTEMDKLDDKPADLKVLSNRNESILKAVQFSIFCEELFYTLMKEALHDASKWTDTAYDISNYDVKKHNKDDSSSSGTHISVLHVLDDEIHLRVNERYHLTIKLIDMESIPKNSADQTEDDTKTEDDNFAAKEEQTNLCYTREEPQKVGSVSLSKRSSSETQCAASSLSAIPPSSDEAYLTQTCRYAVLLLQQELRTRHGRNDISRALLYTGLNVSAMGGGTINLSNPGGGVAGMGHANETYKLNNGPGTLATVLKVLAHNLLKKEVACFLDEISSVLSFQKQQTSASTRILDDGSLQPICDSVRGIYLAYRWKTCAFDSTLSAFDLVIGKNFSTEVLITGARILLQTGMASQSEASGVEGLREFVEMNVCSQVALALHQDALSFGLKQSSMNLDRTSVRLVVAGEWDGSCIGEGRVSDTRKVGTVFLRPYFSCDGSLAIKCSLQAIDTSRLAPVQATLPRPAAGEVHKLKWRRIPGSSDTMKLLWLLQRTGVLNEPYKETIKSEKAPVSNGIEGLSGKGTR